MTNDPPKIYDELGKVTIQILVALALSGIISRAIGGSIGGFAIILIGLTSALSEIH